MRANLDQDVAYHRREPRAGADHPRPRLVRPRPVPTRRRRALRTIHRWTGLCAALFLAILAISGLLANHTHELGLDQASIESTWIRNAYGLPEPVPPRGVQLDNQWLAWASDNVLLAGESHHLNALIGAVVIDGLIVAASADELLLLTPDGQLVERMTEAAIPDSIRRIGLLGSRVAIETNTGVFLSDDGLLEWTGGEVRPGQVEWGDATVLPEAEANQLTPGELQPDLTWERFLLDLHSGRVFGMTGRILADLTAIAILYLLISGLTTWRRNGR